MSGKTTSVQLVLSLKGNLGRDLTRITTEHINQVRQINTDWRNSTIASAKFTEQTRQAASEVKRVDNATIDLVRTNRLLEGLNRQNAIQTRLLSQQLKQQNRDYELQTRLLREQARHAHDLQRAMAEAARNQRDMSRQHAAGGGNGWLATAGGVMGGATAAYGVVRSPLERARSFETKIFDAATSITGGYKDMSSAQVKSSNLTLAQYAKDAVRQGHGSVEGISDSAGILAASGLYKTVQELKEPLKAIAKTAFSAGADEQDVAGLTRQIRQFDIAPERTQIALDRATTSGFLGGFELKDMARLLPEVLPYAKTAGYSGEQGLNAVTTHMQLARKYTGLPSQAADNMRDLYNLFQQHHFSLAVGKFIKPEAGDPIKKIGLRGNRLGFDINTYLANKKLEGVDTVTATVMLMNRQLSKNKRFVDLQQQITTAEKSGNTDQSTTLKKEAAQIVAGGEFGKIFHNQQSLSGLMAIIAGLNNGEFERISKGSWDGVGAVDRVAKEKSKIEPAQAHALEQESILATIKVYDSIKTTLGNFENGLVNAMRANQALTAAAFAAAGALAVLTAAAVGKRMLGGGVAVSPGGAPAASGGAAGAAGSSRLATRIGNVSKVATVATVGFGVLRAVDAYGNPELNRDEKVKEYRKAAASTLGGLSGGYAGAAAGAAVGSMVFPVVGTVVGGLIGGLAGGLGGSYLGDMAGENIHNMLETVGQNDTMIEQQSDMVRLLGNILQKMESGESSLTVLNPSLGTTDQTSPVFRGVPWRP